MGARSRGPGAGELRGSGIGGWGLVPLTRLGRQPGAKAWWFLLVTVLVCAPAQAYYQYVHYLNGNYDSPVYEKFNLAALPDSTVTFFVADTGAQTYGTNDDFSSIISQVEQAAIAWNSVSSSALRVAFGGLESPDQTENTPGGDVVFTDLPPGLLGLGGTNVPATATPVNGPNGPYIPIARSIIQLTANTSNPPGPSYLESFFTTAVHEMGHALGLQHTWTSAAMSQDVIRNTSRARPIDADDRASLSVLYGTAKWTAGYGSISGRVTMNGQPVVLASVVAIPPVGPAVSALTNPDGTYTINGIPPNNNYLLYVHPLPPDAVVSDGDGLRLPVDQNGNPIQPSGPFFTVFYQDANNPGQPQSFSMTPGMALTGVNFSVTPESAVSMYDMITSSYSSAAEAWNSPAYVNTMPGSFLVRAYANPPLVTPVPQSITILGGFGNATICAASGNYNPQNATLPCFQPFDTNTGQTLAANTTDPAAALAIYFGVPLGTGIGPRHLVFTLANGDLYVLPDGVNLVDRNPPQVSSVAASGGGMATVSGSDFSTSSTVYFDGEPAIAQETFGGSSSQGTITVMPPPGYSGQNASVIVYNSDGQNSTFYQSQNPPTYSYPVTGTPQITVNPESLPSGVSSMIDITASNMQFESGQVTVGLGTTDVAVRRVWVLSPTHLVANLVAASNAAIGASEISVISGFQIAQPGSFQLQPGNASTPFVALPIINNSTSQPFLSPGAVGSIYGTGLAASPNSSVVMLNGQTVQVLYASPVQVDFVIPSNFPTGLAPLTLNNGTATSPPMELEIDSAQPVIQQVIDSGQLLNSAGGAASPGDTLVATVSSVPASVAGNPNEVQVTLSGVPLPVLEVSPGPQAGAVLVTFVVNQSFGGSTVPVVVTVDGVASVGYTVVVE
jgi:uncharacterized protein (TIGR03437 family)